MADMTDRYLTISEQGSFVLKERRSRFIATALPASTVEEAKVSIEKISKGYPDARHNCWAYRVGFPDTLEHSSDDGEPSGSAGRPILGAIMKADLYDLAVVVTRYFGGVKLGVRGLIDAYSLSTSEALDSCKKEEMLITVPFEFTTSYDQYGDCLHHVTTLGIEEQWMTPSFEQAVSVRMKVPLSLSEKMETLLENLRQRSILNKWGRP